MYTSYLKIIWKFQIETWASFHTEASLYFCTYSPIKFIVCRIRINSISQQDWKKVLKRTKVDTIKFVLKRVHFKFSKAMYRESLLEMLLNTSLHKNLYIKKKQSFRWIEKDFIY